MSKLFQGKFRRMKMSAALRQTLLPKLTKTAALSRINSRLKLKGLQPLASLDHLPSLGKALQGLQAPFQRRLPPPSLESLGLPDDQADHPESQPEQPEAEE